ncbi:alpha/beta fold hydrolase [Actinocrispum wychmicini]|uniref:alpha/beta fold hydrolase n=1 Tax=Actinocrispum wychmicini TaxID=1213861 RepID=UPI001A9FC261|nr:alpha/beta fold hydrolase [Actinocrispum wychmicini]
MARRKATGERIGVLLTNPGGPGDSGVDFVLRAPTYFSPDVQARFDIVGFDPRGIKRTHPITCSPDVLARQPSAYPRDQAEFDRIAAYNRTLRKDCQARTGPVYDHLDTLSTVQDMDAIRRALGERRISYFGHSYGTVMGEQYAELFGDRVRAMTLTGTVDHSADTTSFFTDVAGAAEDSFDEFVKWCAGNPVCPPDVASVWDNALAKLDPDSQAAVAFRATGMLKGPQWPELAKWIPTISPMKMPVPPQFVAILCQDWQVRPQSYVDLARLTAAETQAAPHMRGAPEHFAAVGCIGLPPANNPQHRLHVTHAPTILIAHSRHDPVSAYPWAVNVRQQIGNSVLLTYAGWGHQVYTRNSCTRSAVDTYLTTLRAPADGTRCAP